MKKSNIQVSILPAAVVLAALFCFLGVSENASAKESAKPGPSSWAVEIQKPEQYPSMAAKALREGKVVYLYFYSEFVEVSLDGLPVLEKLAKKNPGKTAVFTINVDAHERLIDNYALDYAPTVYMVRPGQGIAKSYVVDLDEKEVFADFAVSRPEGDGFRKLAGSIKARKPAAVMFYADWCGFCRKMMPHIQAFEKKHKSAVDVLYINIDNDPTVAAAFLVSGIPDVMVLDADGLTVGRLAGISPSQTESALRETFERMGIDLTAKDNKKGKAKS